VHRPRPKLAHSAVIGPFDVRIHLGMRLRLVVKVAELDEVPAEALRFDAGLGDQHRFFPS